MAAPTPDARFLVGPAGRLDSRWSGPAAGQPVVLLHPHPRFGGTMGSRLVYDLAAGLADAGLRVVRFDFRGVGRSEGTYADGVGEALDAEAVLDHVAAEAGRTPWLVGYSFGGAVALRAATRRAVARLVVIGTPLRLTESQLDPSADAPRCLAERVDVVLGDHDGFVTVAQAHQLAAGFPRPAAVHVVPGAAHFLEPSYNPACVALVRRLLAPKD